MTRPIALRMLCCSLFLIAMVDESHGFLPNQGLAHPPETELVSQCPTASKIDLSDPDNLADKNLWQVLREGFRIPLLYNKSVKHYEKRFSENPETLRRTLQRASVFLPLIVEQLDQRRMPLDLALLPFIESSFNPLAVSKAGAAGLWQIIPTTAHTLGLRINSWYDERLDPVVATKAALTYLERLVEIFDQDWHLALASYNGGLTKVRREMRRSHRQGGYTNLESLDLYQETRNYVPKLIAIRNIIDNPGAYCIRLPLLAIKSSFASIKLTQPIHLADAADSLGLSLDAIQFLNPGFKRQSTPPTGSYYLHLPTQHRANFVDYLD